MSEFHVKVVRLGKIEKHPNADALDITTVLNGYPVIVRKGQFQEGQLAVYVPIDSMVPVEDLRWSFLNGRTHIKAKKLRGIFSMGLLTDADPSWVEDQNVQTELNIGKWEPEVKLHTSGDNESDPGFLPVYDIEGLRRWPDILDLNEEVIYTEKLHGTNFRTAYHQDRFWVASRTQFKKSDFRSVWWKAAIDNDLESKLKNFPGYAVYGEVFGSVQDLKYGCKNGEVKFRVFDILHIQTRRWLDHDEMLDMASKMGLETVPVLYRGLWNPALAKEMAEGQSTIADNIREGVVIKPTKDRQSYEIGRVILKLVGESYLLR